MNAGKMINMGLKAAPEIRRGSIFARMSRYELVEYYRSLYIQGGIKALSYASRGGKIADGILGAQTLLFCVANATPHADIMALRPRSIGVTEFADRFVLNFLEAPAQPVTDTMLALVDAVA
ncbi:hypothetical protein C3R74_03615 [Acidithiobacillus ferridurans]|uniref:DUF6858 family protein n=1 Tax=Acidithiobacillus ferridurans TaxID=1232575 RepID=UPI000DE2672C|nr:hypothetical protein [Acidithiobacillus ferridurans]RBM02066.1 hypothetical protein C3R74_03615 [Acidithiobacillus ferridurans]